MNGEGDTVIIFGTIAYRYFAQSDPSKIIKPAAYDKKGDVSKRVPFFIIAAVRRRIGRVGT